MPDDGNKTGDLRIKVYQDEAGEYRWTAYKGSRKVADSGEGYEKKSWALHMVTALFPDVPVIEGDTPDEDVLADEVSGEDTEPDA